MGNIRAVIFDFGGTLFTYELLEKSQQNSVVKLAALLERDVPSTQSAFVSGMSRAAEEYSKKTFYLHRDLYATGVNYASGFLDRTLSTETVDDFVSWLNSTITDNIVPRQGLHKVLTELRQRNIHVGGASNADIEQFEPMLDSLDVRSLFDTLMCSEQVQYCKPSREFFNRALKQAGCSASEALYVGDTPVADIDGAEGAGMHALLIEETSNLVIDRGAPKPNQAIIKELAELLPYLDKFSELRH